MPNIVSLSFGETKISGWTQVSVSRSLDALADSFSLQMTDAWEGAPVEMKPNVPCVISIDGRKVLTGYTDQVTITVDGSNHIYKVNGRSRTCDLIDCSADFSPGVWTNATPEAIIFDLTAQYGISLVVDTDLGEKVKKFMLNNGESPFDAIQRICQDRAVLFLTDVNGDLYITSEGSERAHDKLIYGQNIIQAEADYDFKNRFQTYKMKAQRPSDGSGWKKSNTQVFAQSSDDGIDRTRIKIFTADNQMTSSLAQKRVNWEAQTRAGRSGKITLSIPSWYQSDGSLWEPNQLVSCQVSPLRLTPDSPLLINSVAYTQGANGTQTKLTMVRKGAYAAEPPKTIKTKPKKKTRGFNW